MDVLISLTDVISFLDNISLDIFTDELIYTKSKHLLNKNEKINIHFNLKNNVLRNADCIMTDVFTSMNDKENKENLLKRFQVNQSIMSLIPKKSVFMHCLPAKIGSEVTEDVIKGERSIVYQQAKNRMVAQRGILKWLGI